MVQSMTEIDELRAQVAALTERLSALEGTRPAAAASGITEEEVIAISAAVAAYFGVRVHIKAIRLVSSRAWAQEGRVSIQASHRLHG
jgi:methylmalonyl-CoA carboxyltransferase large subunit